MFNIANQRNANQNNNEISPHTCQNDYHQNVYKKEIGKDIDKKEWNHSTLLLGW